MGLLDRLASRRSDPEPAESSGSRVEEPVFSTKALRKFLSTLASREAPTLMDLAPVVGGNLNFFGDHLGCKVMIEDIYAEVERHAREQKLADLPAFLTSRFRQPDASVDGILCWDVMDYLDRAAAQALAEQLTRVLKPEGALLAFFGTAQPRDAHYTRYVIVDDVNLKHRPYPATRGRQAILANRDIIRLFDRLRVSDSFLLQNNLREILFRKPSYETR
ncbi:MAG TPA: methyltransferase domain-containing protein [Vicinamibacterales bacterium]|nr:methyltransferase domain-containing protein [Vicinamibacterales bacterium]